MTTAAVNAPVTRAAASTPVHSELNTAKSKTETATGSMNVTGSSRSRAHPGRTHLDGGWREELQRDAVRVAEAQARAVVGVHDAAVADALRASLWDGGQWIADYRRLRVVAVKH